MTRGTPHTEGIIPLLGKSGVPLIGPPTDAMVLKPAAEKHIFNVRATYQREAEKAVAHLDSIGITRIAVVHVNDSFGSDGLDGTQKGLTSAKLKAVAIAKFDHSKPDFSTITPVLAEGLRCAGANPTRGKLQAALESIQKFNIGGLEVSFTPTDHTGMDFADLSIVGPDSKFKR